MTRLFVLVKMLVIWNVYAILGQRSKPLSFKKLQFSVDSLVFINFFFYYYYFIHTLVILQHRNNRSSPNPRPHEWLRLTQTNYVSFSYFSSGTFQDVSLQKLSLWVFLFVCLSRKLKLYLFEGFIYRYIYIYKYIYLQRFYYFICLVRPLIIYHFALRMA